MVKQPAQTQHNQQRQSRLNKLLKQQPKRQHLFKRLLLLRRKIPERPLQYQQRPIRQTATGVNLKANPDAKVIAVDPSVIPLGSKVYVEGYGYATAADTGGAIKGNKIDVFIPSHDQAMQWGRKTVEVQVLN